MSPRSPLARARRLAHLSRRVARTLLRPVRRIVRRLTGHRTVEIQAARRIERLRSQRDRARERLATAVAARDALRDRVAELSAELEAARAEGAAASGRDPRGLSYLFVVAYGRSGSTLLQGILSSIPGVVIRGENGGALRHLFAFHDTVRGHQQRLARPEPLPRSHPWWGIDGYPVETALRDLRVLVLETLLRPPPGTRIVGCKEIDWPTEGLPEVLDFLRAVFPGARFVLNTRNLADVAASKWWADRPDAMQRLQELEGALVGAVAGLGEAGFRVHYDDYVTDPSALRGLFDWLGEDFDEERVREVLAVPHSY